MATGRAVLVPRTVSTANERRAEDAAVPVPRGESGPEHSQGLTKREGVGLQLMPSHHSMPSSAS